MDITLEEARRGSEALPLGLYRQGAAFVGACITPLHYHKDLELVLATEGGTALVRDGEIIETQTGVLYFINPYQIHSMHVAKPSSRYDCLVIPPSLLALPVGHAAMSQLITPIFNGKLCFANQTQDPFLIDLLKRMIACYEQKEKQAAPILAYLLLFLDHCRKQGLLQETSHVPTTPIRKAVDYIRCHFNQKISLGDMAAAVGMNPKYFCTYFKKQTLTTPVAFLTMIRIRHAKLLLQQQELSVLEVALSCGFDNVSFFIRQFKRATGQTPGQYRKSVCQ